jgi:hypothetical protein
LNGHLDTRDALLKCQDELLKEKNQRIDELWKEKNQRIDKLWKEKDQLQAELHLEGMAALHQMAKLPIEKWGE